MSKENRYYVYGHYLEDGTLFYIGKGCNKRHCEKTKRSASWNKFTENKIWYSKIIEDNLTNSEALIKERNLIFNSKSNLINVKVGNLKIDLQAIKNNLIYDPTSSTGLRFVNNGSSGRKGTTCKYKAGDEAGSKRTKGYLSITCCVNKIHYIASRVIWYLVYGVYPNEDQVIDHINGNSLDNRVENLRICSQHFNTKNKKMREDNTSGHVGVYFVKGEKYNYWQASYTDNFKTKCKTY